VRSIIPCMIPAAAVVESICRAVVPRLSSCLKSRPAGVLKSSSPQCNRHHCHVASTPQHKHAESLETCSSHGLVVHHLASRAGLPGGEGACLQYWFVCKHLAYRSRPVPTCVSFTRCSRSEPRLPRRSASCGFSDMTARCMATRSTRQRLCVIMHAHPACRSVRMAQAWQAASSARGGASGWTPS
jgi:hypothetical protein